MLDDDVGPHQLVTACWRDHVIGDPGMIKSFDPPRPVVVDTQAWDAHGGRPPGFNAHPPTLAVRAGGIRLEPAMLGHQVAWVRIFDGQWRALITIDLTSANRSTTVRSTLWLPATAFSPVDKQGGGAT